MPGVCICMVRWRWRVLGLFIRVTGKPGPVPHTATQVHTPSCVPHQDLVLAISARLPRTLARGALVRPNTSPSAVGARVFVRACREHPCRPFFPAYLHLTSAWVHGSALLFLLPACRDFHSFSCTYTRWIWLRNTRNTAGMCTQGNGGRM